MDRWTFIRTNGLTVRELNGGVDRLSDRHYNYLCFLNWKRSFPKMAQGRKEGNVLFNDALNTFYLRLFDVRHMVKDDSDTERGNPLPPFGLLFPINNKGSFICIIPQTG